MFLFSPMVFGGAPQSEQGLILSKALQQNLLNIQYGQNKIGAYHRTDGAGESNTCLVCSWAADF